MRLVWGTAPFNAFLYLRFSVGISVLALSFLRPRLLCNFFVKIEKSLARLSGRPWLCATVLFALPIALRLLLLPVYGPPQPFIHDEYAYLLQSQIFASGALSYPPLPFPKQFESIYVFATPTYNAEYQPAQGMCLAVGRLLFGHPWAGVLITAGLFCAIAYWALLAWLPARWAFGGGLLIVVEIGVLSYWTNSYWGGWVPGIGGALSFGALAPIREQTTALNAVLLAIGDVVLLSSRPFEGLLLSIVTAGLVCVWVLTKRMRLSTVLTAFAVAVLVVAVTAILFFAYYNHAVTGRATRLPYLLYRAKYAIPQGFYWQNSPLPQTAMPVDIAGEYKSQLMQREHAQSFIGLAQATLAKFASSGSSTSACF